jgi:hypothetical protein
MADRPPYNTLPTITSIRLLEIEPGRESEPLRCRLRVADLKDEPEYEALSYCWGNDDRKKTVICDGVEVRLTPNLVKALCRFRRAPSTEKSTSGSKLHRFFSRAADREAQADNLSGIAKKSDPELPDRYRFCGFLWADAICINQEDYVERSKQVVMMGEIYSQAKTVIVWLGEKDVHLPKALELVQACQQEYWKEEVALQTDSGLSRIISPELLTDEKHARRGLPSLNAPQWKAISWFFGLQWFSRLWVLQEVALAKNVVALIGGYEIHSSEFRDIRLAVEWIMKKDYTRILRLDFSALLNAEFVLHNISAIIRDEKRQPLLKLMRETRKFCCTQPQDRVFAVLGIAVENNIQSVRDSLTAVYSRHYREAYWAAVLLLINNNGNLDVLNEVRTPPILMAKDLRPSWVADWSYGNPRASMLHAVNFKACGDIIRELEPTSDKRILRVKGFEVDSIRECRIFPSTRTGVFEVIPRVLALTFSNVRSNPRVYVNGDSLAVAFTHTIMIGRDFASSGPASDDPGSIAHASDYWRKAWKSNLLPELQGVQESMRQYLEKAIPMFDTTIHHTCNSRAFFLTKGGYIGIGPRWMRPNDRVVILYGGKTPYILRDENDSELDPIWTGQGFYGQSCRLVGECYVHGMMYGEMVEGKDRGKDQQEIFFNIW